LIDRQYLLNGNDKKILDVSISLLETLFMDNKSNFMQFVGLGTSEITDDLKIIVFWDVMLCSLVAKYCHFSLP